MSHLTRRFAVIFALGFICATPSRVRADERLKGIACRSVHLGFNAPAGVAFYNEITIEKSALGTYFMVCGWDKGYFGLQELGNGKKLLLFSVWDSELNDPKAVKEDRRTMLIYKDEKVRVGRFGGEGTGGQSFFDYDWKLGQTYRLLVTSKINGTRTEYSGYFFVPEEKAWKHLVTFSTVTGGRPLGGYYSFIEDFKRDKVSTTKPARGSVRQRLDQGSRRKYEVADECPLHRRRQSRHQYQCRDRRGPLFSRHRRRNEELGDEAPGRHGSSSQ